MLDVVGETYSRAITSPHRWMMMQSTVELAWLLLNPAHTCVYVCYGGNFCMVTPTFQITLGHIKPAVWFWVCLSWSMPFPAHTQIISLVTYLCWQVCYRLVNAIFLCTGR